MTRWRVKCESMWLSPETYDFDTKAEADQYAEEQRAYQYLVTIEEVDNEKHNARTTDETVD